MRSAIRERLKAAPRALDVNESYGLTGASGERYEPESRVEFVEAYRDRVWTQRCVNLIRNSATQVPMVVKRKGSKDWEETHELIDLLRRPNPRDPATTFFDWTLLWAETIGEWYWEIVPSVLGGIAELFPLRGHLVRILPGKAGRAEGYVYDPNETGVDVVTYAAPVPGEPTISGAGDKSVVLSGRYANPFDDYYGMGPLRAAKDDIISEYYGVRYDHRFFRNSARPDIVLGFKGKQDAEQRRANKEAWNEFKGVDRAHRAAVLDGDPNVHILSQNQKDVEYLEGRYLSREGQCAAFGIPPILVGDMRRATYSNFENAEPIFWKATMLSKLEFLATWATFVFGPYYEDVEEFNFDVSQVAALQRVEGWRSERIVGEVSGGVLTPNEAREQLDRDQVEEELADQLWMPTKAKPISSSGAPATPPPAVPPPGQAVPPPDGTPEGEAVGDTGAGAGTAEAATARAKYAASFAIGQKGTVQGWLRNALAAKRRFSERAKTEVTLHFAQQRRALMELIDGQKNASDLVTLLEGFGWDKDDADFHRIIDAMQAGLAAEALDLTAATLDVDAGPGLLERCLKEVGNRADGISGVSRRVKDEVLEEVRTGLQHGLTYRQIAEGGTYEVDGKTQSLKGVRGVYDEYETWQGERIARTEAAVTFNHTSAQLMREAGVEQVEISDGDSDEDCGLANGSTWTLSHYEANLISHPNCTRIGLPVVKVPDPAGV